METLKLSDRLRMVLQDLKQITDALEKVEVNREGVANDDFLTRGTTTKPDV